MEDWLRTAESFVDSWRSEPLLIGALVCGSFVTGKPTPHSDLDIHLLLSPESRWRERGNFREGAYLIEYFANPSRQIRSYFRNDYAANSTMNAVMFVTGHLIFDSKGEIADLKKEANEWLQRPFSTATDEKGSQLDLYGLWDSYDNLLDALHDNRVDASYLYHHVLSQIYGVYARHLGWHVASVHQHHRLIVDPQFRKNYLIPSIGDKEFGRLFDEAIRSTREDDQENALESLVLHVMEQMGGFDVSDWSYRCPVSE